MTKGAFLIRPENGTLLAPDGFTTLAWPTDGGPATTVISSLGWNLAPLHGITPQAADLVHLAAGAYMADRSTARGVRFSRDLQLKVAVQAPEVWSDEVLRAVAELLGWLTGDVWEVSVVPAPDTDLPAPASRLPRPERA